MASEPPTKVYGIGVDVPVGYLDRIMDAIDAAMEPVYPGYRRCFRYYEVTGTWKCEPGSHPFLGTPGEISVEKEYRLECLVREEDLRAVIGAIEKAHPFEEPAVDVYPEIPWRSLIPPSL
ncbi:MAG: hypothetical protein ACOX8X_02450 [Methanomethylophilus sp.]|jgi:hypothetical protein